MTTYIDPVEAASDHYTLLLDGERARIVEMRLPAGARDNEHSHPNEFVYFVKGSAARIYVGDEIVELDIPDGMVMEHEPWTHSVENVGDSEIVALIFELKD
jgi:quercetin dioxygenase-like cupin family protein